MAADVLDRLRRRAGDGAGPVALAVTVVVAALAGCGGGGTESRGSAAGTTTSAGKSTTAPRSTTTSTSTTNAEGGSGGGQVGQRLTIPQVVDAVLTSSDPAKACGSKYVTSHYLNVAYGGKEGCVQAQSQGSAAQSVRIQQLNAPDTTIAPNRTTAKVVPQGGVYAGEKLTVSLLHEGGTWKVDALKSNAPVGP